MASTKSAKKNIRQNERRRLLNRSNKSRMRTAVKAVEKLTPDADGSTAAAALSKAASELDKAGRKRLIHPNAAARQKSRLARHLAKVSAAPQA